MLVGFPPSLISALWNIGILPHKKAKLRKHMRQSVVSLIFIGVDNKTYWKYVACRFYSNVFFNQSCFFQSLVILARWSFSSILTCLKKCWVILLFSYLTSYLTYIPERYMYPTDKEKSRQRDYLMAYSAWFMPS